MTRLVYLFPLAILIIRRHAAAAWVLDVIGGPMPRWQVAAFGTLFGVWAGLVCAAVCVAWLVWYWWQHERPLNTKRQP